MASQVLTLNRRNNSPYSNDHVVPEDILFIKPFCVNNSYMATKMGGGEHTIDPK